MRPLKWPGNKAGHPAERLAGLLGEERPLSWHEPFFGGGGLLATLVEGGQVVLGRDELVLSDVSQDLDTIWTVVRCDPEALDAALGELAWGPEWADGEVYFDVRRAYNLRSADLVQQAAWGIWLSRACTNGLWRVNSKGEFNQSKGSYVELHRPGLGDLQRVQTVLRAASWSCCDWREHDYAISGRDRGVVVVDPPYLPLSPTSSHVGYAAAGFKARDHVELAARLSLMRREGIEVFVFGQSPQEMSLLYPEVFGWKHHSLVVRRTGACTGSRPMVSEVIVQGRPV